MRRARARRALMLCVSASMSAALLLAAAPANAADKKVDDSWVTGSFGDTAIYDGPFIGPSDKRFVAVAPEAASRKVVTVRYGTKRSYSTMKAYATYDVRLLELPSKKVLGTVRMDPLHASFFRTEFSGLFGASALGGSSPERSHMTLSALKREAKVVNALSDATMYDRVSRFTRLTQIEAVQQTTEALYSDVLQKWMQGFDAADAPTSMDAYPGSRSFRHTTTLYTSAGTEKHSATATFSGTPDDLTIVAKGEKVTYTSRLMWIASAGWFSLREKNELSRNAASWHDLYTYFHKR